MFLGDIGPITCPDGWIPYIDHCYKIFRETKGWEEALTSCQKEESHLASIQSLEEHSFIVSRLGYSECFRGGLLSLSACKKHQLAESRCSNCIHMKHCSQRHARSQRSSGVRLVQYFPFCFNTDAAFLWKNNIFVPLSVHLGNLRRGSTSLSASCGQPASRSASSQVSAEVMEETY